MKIYTSYFGNNRKLKESNVKIVSIAKSAPGGFGKESIQELAPSRELLNTYKSGNMSIEEYEKMYLTGLEQVDMKDIHDKIKSYRGDVALCCWEGKGKFCHRHIISSLLNRIFDLNIEEF